MVEGCFASTVTSCFDILVASQTVADSFVLPGDPYHCPVPVVSSDTTDSKSIRSTQPPAGPLCVCVCVCVCVYVCVCPGLGGRTSSTVIRVGGLA